MLQQNETNTPPSPRPGPGSPGEAPAGNEAEWTSSLFKPYPYDASDGREDPNAAGQRVTRGGDHVFDVAADQLTGYFRQGFSRDPRAGHRHIGFRCAKDAG